MEMVNIGERSFEFKSNVKLNWFVDSFLYLKEKVNNKCAETLWRLFWIIDLKIFEVRWFAKSKHLKLFGNLYWRKIL